MIHPNDLDRLAVRVESLMRVRTHDWHPADELDLRQRLPGGRDRRKLPSPEELRGMAADLRADSKSHPDLEAKYRLWIGTALDLEGHVHANDPRNPRRMIRDIVRGRRPF